MIDIVEKLRIDRHTPREEWIWRKIAKDAADEIERLRDESRRRMAAAAFWKATARRFAAARRVAITAGKLGT